MAEALPVTRRRIDRRIVLQAAAAMAAAGPALLRGGHAEAQPRASVATLFAYVGAFTTPERKGHGGGINVYRVDPAWAPGATYSSSKSSTPLSLRSTGRSAFSMRSTLTSTRSAPMRSTSKPGASRRSTGNPAAARTRCTCRSIRPVAGSSPPITAPARSASCRSRRTEPWGRAPIWSPCKASPAQIASDRRVRIHTKPFSIQAAGLSPCPIWD